jgi:hypothetical protein
MSEESTPKSTAIYCPYCGEEIEKKEGFCPGCGVNLTDGEQNGRGIKGNETEEEEAHGEEESARGNAPKRVPRALVPSPPKTRGTRCINCKGTGFCQFCHGAGSIHGDECSECGGSGRCASCNGTGRL